jgi:hypothetical protein
MNPTLLALLIALLFGIVTDLAVTKMTKVGWLGTLLGMAVFAATAFVGLTLS